MKINTESTERGRVYMAPLCTMSEISPEGILCSSIEGLGNEFDFVWEDEE